MAESQDFISTSATNLKRHHSRPDECVKTWQAWRYLEGVTNFGGRCSIFCGMRAYFERFIQAFEEIVVILSCLILKGVPDVGCFDWKSCHWVRISKWLGRGVGLGRGVCVIEKTAPVVSQRIRSLNRTVLMPPIRTCLSFTLGRIRNNYTPPWKLTWH